MADSSKSRKAVVLLSGGMDSCVCTAIARERHGAARIALLHAGYGQRTQSRERQAFDAIADFYDTRQRLVVQLDHFRVIGGSALTDPSIAVPENVLGGEGDHSSSIPVTYVPFRNAHFLSVAVSWAEAIGAGAIYIGAVAEDSSGYPDCRPEYYRVFQELIRVGTRPETEIEMVTPVIGLKKSEIIRRGLELGAPLRLTWSCYQNDDAACGVCDSCLLRLRAFAEAGVADPIPYRQADAAGPIVLTTSRVAGKARGLDSRQDGG
jgi:7-cyano-7-deazaguanine synthase